MYNILFACFLFALGQTLGWFQLNSQFVWEWWKDKPLLAAILYSVPTGICFGTELKFVMRNGEKSGVLDF